MRRTVIPELLDDDARTPAEVALGLADLDRINRWFGGVSGLARQVEQVARATGRRELTLLDVGGATGTLTRRVRHCLQPRGIRLEVTVLDRAASHLAGGHRPSVAAGATALPFRGSSFDLVACSLFLHHLEPEEVRQFANEALRVARLALLINDIRRHPVHLALVYAGMPLYRSRLTRHDAPVSIHRAYTAAEVGALLAQTNASRVDLGTHYLYRMAAIAWRDGVAP
jgi:ubiquinone/menaquinone biosynthesis C-methylase UbiE